MGFRDYLSGTIFIVLFIWGPINHSWPSWFLVRSGYLILVPLTVWLLLRWLWHHWEPNKKTENTLERILSGIICITLFVFAFLAAISKDHFGNTQVIRTRDGMEDVGDYIVLPGPDWGNVFLLVIFALLVLWFGVIKNEANSSDS